MRYFDAQPKNFHKPKKFNGNNQTQSKRSSTATNIQVWRLSAGQPCLQIQGRFLLAQRSENEVSCRKVGQIYLSNISPRTMIRKWSKLQNSVKTIISFQISNWEYRIRPREPEHNTWLQSRGEHSIFWYIFLAIQLKLFLG